MRYFKLMMDDSNEDDVVCYSEDTHGFEQYDLVEGRKIENWNEEITFSYDPKEGNRVTDYLANDEGWFLVSTALKETMDELGEAGIQYLPVHVVNRADGSHLEGYFVANVLNVVDALNLEHSDYESFDEDDEEEEEDQPIYMISLYAVNGDKVEGKHAFKLQGHEIPLFISEALKDAIEAKGLTGCEFLEIDVV